MTPERLRALADAETAKAAADKACDAARAAERAAYEEWMARISVSSDARVAMHRAADTLRDATFWATDWRPSVVAIPAYGDRVAGVVSEIRATKAGKITHVVVQFEKLPPRRFTYRHGDWWHGRSWTIAPGFNAAAAKAALDAGPPQPAAPFIDPTEEG